MPLSARRIAKHLAACCVVLGLVLASQPPAIGADSAAAAPGAAETIYAAGKASYDQGDFEAAQRAFREAARIEPGNPRWHYNLGLALRQRGQFQPARDAFLTARQLDPGYKRAEIDDKLAAMGFDPAASGASRSAASLPERRDGDEGDWGSLAGIVFWLFAGVLGYWFFKRRRRPAGATTPASVPSLAVAAADPQALDRAMRRLIHLGTALIAAERSLGLGEDADLRALLDAATRLEGTIRSKLAAGSASEVASAAGLLDEAEALAGRIRARIAETGTQTDQDPPRAGCFFCARALANDRFRRVVPVRDGGATVDLLACPACAGEVTHGRTPATVVVEEGGELKHWSEVPGYDPLVHRHAPHAGERRTDTWRLDPATRSRLPQLAALAAGGFLGAGAAAAYASSPALDLEAATQAGLAEEAARAAALSAAKKTGGEARGSIGRDHS